MVELRQDRLQGIEPRREREVRVFEGALQERDQCLLLLSGKGRVDRSSQLLRGVTAFLRFAGQPGGAHGG
jgi:hypothetical protein